MALSVEDRVQIGEWLVDPARDIISRGGESHKLEPRTMRLLLSLAEAAGGVVSVDRLLADVWSGVIVTSASVYQAISQLRKLLGDVDPQPTYIANVPRKGYRLLVPVRPAAPPPVLPPAPRRHTRLLVVGALVLVVLAMLVIGAIFVTHGAQRRLPVRCPSSCCPSST